MDPHSLTAPPVAAMAIFLPSTITPSGPEATEYLKKEITPRIIFAVPIAFFKSISIFFGGAGLIFEGLTNRGGSGNETFCQGLLGANPQRSNQSVLLRNLCGRCFFRKKQGPHSDESLKPCALCLTQGHGLHHRCNVFSPCRHF